MKRILLFAITISMISIATAAWSDDELSFKGIVIGQDFDTFDAFINEKGGWEYKFPPKGESDQFVFLKGEGLRPINIGCKGEDGKGSCYWLNMVSVEFYDNKIMSLVLGSPEYSADKIEHWVKDWCAFAQQALSQKYGNPQILKQLNDINIFDFKEGYYTYIASWPQPTGTINLALSTYEYKYTCNVIFTDAALSEKKKNTKTKIKSGF